MVNCLVSNWYTGIKMTWFHLSKYGHPTDDQPIDFGHPAAFWVSSGERKTDFSNAAQWSERQSEAGPSLDHFSRGGVEKYFLVVGLYNVSSAKRELKLVRGTGAPPCPSQWGQGTITGVTGPRATFLYRYKYKCARSARKFAISMLKLVKLRTFVS